MPSEKSHAASTKAESAGRDSCQPATIAGASSLPAKCRSGASAFSAANSTGPPDGNTRPSARAVPRTRSPFVSGCCPMSTRPLAGSAASHTRYHCRDLIGASVASRSVPPCHVSSALAPVLETRSAIFECASCSASTVVSASSTPDQNSTVQVHAERVSRTGPAETTPYEPSRIGWRRPVQVRSRTPGTSSSRMPGPAGFGSADTTRFSDARYAPPSRTLT